MNIQSWATFRKNNNPDKYFYQDGTLGIIYYVEPTLIKLGFIRGGTLNECNHFGIPLSVYGNIKEKVNQFIDKNDWCKKYTTCIYYPYRVRQEYSTQIVEVYFK